MRLSRVAAIAIGVLAPLLDTIRRWNTWTSSPHSLLDDYLIGALLLGGAWLIPRDRERGRLLLAAGWGFTCAMAYVSVFGQLAMIRAGGADPSGVSLSAVLAVKLLGAAIAAIALAVTVFDRRPE